ncbi:MAG: AAA family ATPase [Candidatus Omnitrophica bacterium]|nr:AAA family ATPase [Candidatus Omnitrophota bacterium]
MKHSTMLKIIALLIMVVFATNTIVWSSPDFAYKVRVPEKYGKVKQRYKGTSEKVIINIQDAHSSFEAQKNLARIICDLIPQIKKTEDGKQTTEKKNLTSVPFIGIEGAVGSYDLKELREFPIQETKEAVGAEYVQEGKFIGAEFANIIADNDFTLYGLEDKDLFRDEYRAFYTVMLKHKELAGEIRILEEHVMRLKEATYNKRLKSFDETAAQYENGSLALLEFFPVVYEKIEQLQIDVFEYVHLAQFKEVSQNIHENKAALLDMAALVRDTRMVTHEIRNRLATSRDERKLIALAERIMHLKQLVALRAQKEDVEKFRKEREQYAFKVIGDEIAELDSNFGAGRPHSADTINREQMFDCIDQFYAYADKRDRAMVDNLIKKMDETGQLVGVLVAGGYHSESIIQLLKERGISYLTVTPHLDSAVEDVAYLNRMMGHIAPLDPLFTSSFQISRLNSSVQAINETFFNDIRRTAKKDILGETLLNMKGKLVSPAHVKELIARLTESGKPHDTLIADALKTIYDEIVEKKLIDRLLSEGYTLGDMPAKVTTIVTESVRTRLGDTIDKQIDLEKFSQVMQSEYEHLLLAQPYFSHAETGRSEVSTQKTKRRDGAGWKATTKYTQDIGRELGAPELVTEFFLAPLEETAILLGLIGMVTKSTIGFIGRIERFVKLFLASRLPLIALIAFTPDILPVTPLWLMMLEIFFIGIFIAANSAYFETLHEEYEGVPEPIALGISIFTIVSGVMLSWYPVFTPWNIFVSLSIETTILHFLCNLIQYRLQKWFARRSLKQGEIMEPFEYFPLIENAPDQLRTISVPLPLIAGNLQKKEKRAVLTVLERLVLQINKYQQMKKGAMDYDLVLLRQHLESYITAIRNTQTPVNLKQFKKELVRIAVFLTALERNEREERRRQRKIAEIQKREKEALRMLKVGTDAALEKKEPDRKPVVPVPKIKAFKIPSIDRTRQEVTTLLNRFKNTLERVYRHRTINEDHYETLVTIHNEWEEAIAESSDEDYLKAIRPGIIRCGQWLDGLTMPLLISSEAIKNRFGGDITDVPKATLPPYDRTSLLRMLEEKVEKQIVLLNGDNMLTAEERAQRDLTITQLKESIWFLEGTKSEHSKMIRRTESALEMLYETRRIAKRFSEKQVQPPVTEVDAEPVSAFDAVQEELGPAWVRKVRDLIEIIADELGLDFSVEKIKINMLRAYKLYQKEIELLPDENSEVGEKMRAAFVALCRDYDPDSFRTRLDLINGIKGTQAERFFIFIAQRFTLEHIQTTIDTARELGGLVLDGKVDVVLADFAGTEGGSIARRQKELEYDDAITLFRKENFRPVDPTVLMRHLQGQIDLFKSIEAHGVQPVAVYSVIKQKEKAEIELMILKDEFSAALDVGRKISMYFKGTHYMLTVKRIERFGKYTTVVAYISEGSEKKKSHFRNIDTQRAGRETTFYTAPDLQQERAQREALEQLHATIKVNALVTLKGQEHPSTTANFILDYLLGLRAPPEDIITIEELEEARPYTEGFDKFQRAAVNMIIKSTFAFIHGFFGTGKTKTLMAGVKNLVLEEKKPVLLITPQHKLADDIMHRFVSDVEEKGERAMPMYRFGMAEDKFDPDIKDSLSRRSEAARKSFAEAYRDLNTNKGDAGCLFAATPMGGNFDWLLRIHRNPNAKQYLENLTIIVDEAALINYPELIATLWYLSPESLILMGDHIQFDSYPLEATLRGHGKQVAERVTKETKNFEQIRDRYNTSLFKELVNWNTFNRVRLLKNYRNHWMIIELAQFFYQNLKLKSISDERGDRVKQNTLCVYDTSSSKAYDDYDAQDGFSNTFEAEWIVTKLKEFLGKVSEEGTPYTADDILIITPYNGQVALIQKKIQVDKELQASLSAEEMDALLNNVITSRRIQGGEKKVVLVSFVRSKKKATYFPSIINDPALLLVDETRGIDKLALIGNQRTLSALSKRGKRPDMYQHLFSFGEIFQQVFAAATDEERKDGMTKERYYELREQCAPNNGAPMSRSGSHTRRTFIKILLAFGFSAAVSGKLSWAQKPSPPPKETEKEVTLEVVFYAKQYLQNALTAVSDGVFMPLFTDEEKWEQTFKDQKIGSQTFNPRACGQYMNDLYLVVIDSRRRLKLDMPDYSGFTKKMARDHQAVIKDMLTVIDKRTHIPGKKNLLVPATSKNRLYMAYVMHVDNKIAQVGYVVNEIDFLRVQALRLVRNKFLIGLHTRDENDEGVLFEQFKMLKEKAQVSGFSESELQRITDDYIMKIFKKMIPGVPPQKVLATDLRVPAMRDFLALAFVHFVTYIQKKGEATPGIGFHSTAKELLGAVLDKLLTEEEMIFNIRQYYNIDFDEAHNAFEYYKSEGIEKIRREIAEMIEINLWQRRTWTDAAFFYEHVVLPWFKMVESGDRLEPHLEMTICNRFSTLFHLPEAVRTKQKVKQSGDLLFKLVTVWREEIYAQPSVDIGTIIEDLRTITRQAHIEITSMEDNIPRKIFHFRLIGDPIRIQEKDTLKEISTIDYFGIVSRDDFGRSTGYIIYKEDKLMLAISETRMQLDDISSTMKGDFTLPGVTEESMKNAGISFEHKAFLDSMTDMFRLDLQEILYKERMRKMLQTVAVNNVIQLVIPDEAELGILVNIASAIAGIIYGPLPHFTLAVLFRFMLNEVIKKTGTHKMQKIMKRELETLWDTTQKRRRKEITVAELCTRMRKLYAIFRKEITYLPDLARHEKFFKRVETMVGDHFDRALVQNEKDPDGWEVRQKTVDTVLASIAEKKREDELFRAKEIARITRRKKWSILVAASGVCGAAMSIVKEAMKKSILKEKMKDQDNGDDSSGKDKKREVPPAVTPVKEAAVTKPSPPAEPMTLQVDDEEPSEIAEHASFKEVIQDDIHRELLRAAKKLLAAMIARKKIKTDVDRSDDILFVVADERLDEDELKRLKESVEKRFFTIFEKSIVSCDALSVAVKRIAEFNAMDTIAAETVVVFVGTESRDILLVKEDHRERVQAWTSLGGNKEHRSVFITFLFPYIITALLGGKGEIVLEQVVDQNGNLLGKGIFMRISDFMAAVKRDATEKLVKQAA